MTKHFEFINAAAKRSYLALPKAIQKQFGVDLNAVQEGKDPFSSFEFLTDSVGAGAIELRENGSPAYRAVYCCKYLDTVYVLHAFSKTTNGVDRKNMETAAGRYREMKVKVAAAKKATSAKRKK
jgi:phage-related protein